MRWVDPNVILSRPLTFYSHSSSFVGFLTSTSPGFVCSLAWITTFPFASLETTNAIPTFVEGTLTAAVYTAVSQSLSASSCSLLMPWWCQQFTSSSATLKTDWYPLSVASSCCIRVDCLWSIDSSELPSQLLSTPLSMWTSFASVIVTTVHCNSSSSIAGSCFPLPGCSPVQVWSHLAFPTVCLLSLSPSGSLGNSAVLTLITVSSCAFHSISFFRIPSLFRFVGFLAFLIPFSWVAIASSSWEWSSGGLNSFMPVAAVTFELSASSAPSPSQKSSAGL